VKFMRHRQSNRDLAQLSRKHAARHRGFTLIEVIIAMSIMIVLAGISFMSLQPALRDAHVSNAYNASLEALRQAREWAVTNRKTYLVTITAPGTITTTVLNNGVVAAVPTATTILPTDVQFIVVGPLPSPGPDLMGTGTQAIQFDIGVAAGAANQIYFFPDGSAKDVAGNLNNGVLYIARPGERLSTRAITMLGTAGKLRGWRIAQPLATTWNRQ
jgi:prepilin-type N-terminal cleavage/methylation domain-containing protein